MADFSFAVPTWTDGSLTFPNGTTVNATPLDGSPDDAVTAVASGGTVAFTGLRPFKQYLARATVSGVVREIRFTAPDSVDSSGVVTRDSQGRVASFGSFAVVTRDSAGRVATYSDRGVGYTITRDSQGRVQGVAT